MPEKFVDVCPYRDEHTRVLSAKKLGLEGVVRIIAENLTESSEPLCKLKKVGIDDHEEMGCGYTGAWRSCPVAITRSLNVRNN